MRCALITGGSGFFGDILKKEILRRGFGCVNIDLQKDDFSHPQLVSIQGDIRDTRTLEKVFSQHRFEGIFHCAALLAHSVKDRDFLWTSNVEGTRNIADFAVRYKVPKIVFTSSNCLWAENFKRPVKEDDEPRPVEIYGKSKWEGEKILLGHRGDFDVIIIRCPTIIDSGRLGLLAILFEFIDEGRRIWVVGSGNNRYQFIYAPDLSEACIKALDYKGSDIFNIGSDNVKTFEEVYNYVISNAKTGARIGHLPKRTTLLIMKIASFLKISPLGPYHYKMIAEDFVFDTNKIKANLGWRPTLTNEEMMWKAYLYYHEHRDEIKERRNVSAHREQAKMGLIKVLKWLS